jgi:hypothetical protein
MDEENKFILNLTRLCGATNAVTLDFILETLVYINNNAVVEALFIEESYLVSIFDDEEFLQVGKISICSVQFLINRYEESKRNSDDDFLVLLRQKHRTARAFLNDDAIKDSIRQVIESRKETIKHQATWTTINNIFGLLQHFPTASISRLLYPLLPQLTQSVC